jgi:hypothetical protein
VQSHKKVCLFDLTNSENNVCFNPLEIYGTDPIRIQMDKVLVTDRFIDIIKEIIGEINVNFDIFMRDILEFTFEENPKPTMMDVFKNIEHKKFRLYSFAFSNELSKLKCYIENTTFFKHFIYSQTIDIHKLLSNGNVLLFKLPKNGGDMLAKIILSMTQLSSYQNIHIPSSERIPTFVYIHEMEEVMKNDYIFGAKTLAEILSEARIYRLGLIFSSVNICNHKVQKNKFLTAAIFNNTGTMIHFKPSEEDAPFLEEGYHLDFSVLKQNEAVGRIMQTNGIHSPPMKFTLPV